MDKLSAKIENWAVVDNLIFHGFRKLEPGQRLTGYLMGHSDLPNGVIYTAVIQSVDQANGLVETANSVYRLGQANEFYSSGPLSRAKSPSRCTSPASCPTRAAPRPAMRLRSLPTGKAEAGFLPPAALLSVRSGG